MQTATTLQDLGKRAKNCLGSYKVFAQKQLSFVNIFHSLLVGSAAVGLTAREG